MTGPYRFGAGMFFKVFSIIGLLAGLLVPTAAPARAGGWLGVTIEPPRGVQVAEIIKGSPADLAGLERGDIIQRLDGVEILSIRQFIQAVAATPAATEIKLSIIRKGVEQEVRAKLEESAKHLSVTQGNVHGWRQTAPYDRGYSRYGGSSPHFDRYERREEEMRRPGYGWGRDHGPGYGLDRRMEPGTGPGGSASERGRERPVVKAWLGVAPGLSPDGVLVMSVAPDSPGERAGLHQGDVILSVNAQAVATPRALVRLIGNMQPGTLVDLVINRGGQSQNIQVRLQAPPIGS